MKAAVIHAYGSPDELKFEDMPDPSPGPGEVLIRTAATSINPLDVKMRSGAVKEYFPVSFPTCANREGAGKMSGTLHLAQASSNRGRRGRTARAQERLS
jgi:NADPH:quinone reductase-like Zn-dependent oxidoreductase